MQVTYSPQRRWCPALRLTHSYQPLASVSSPSFLYSQPTPRERVGSATAVILITAAVFVLLGFFVLPSSTSSAPTPYGPPISKPVVFVAPLQCGSLVSVAAVTPLFAMPLVNDTVDLVSGQSIVTSDSVPTFQSYSWRDSSLYLTGDAGLTLSATIASATAFTYCFWFYISGYNGAGFPAVMLGSADSNRVPTMCLGVSQVGVFFLGRGTSDGQCTCPANNCRALAAYNALLYTSWGPYLYYAGNQWHWSHVCYTYSAQTACIYINGTKGSCTDVNMDDAVTGTSIEIGPFLGGVSNPFIGGIQCLSGYNVALDADQIVSMRVNQMGGCAALSAFSSFNCLAAPIPTPVVPTFLTGATEITPIPSITFSTRNPSSFQRTLYISQIYGNDNNNGLSPDSAWQTLANINSQTAVEPGDSYLLCNGDNQYSPSRGINFFYSTGDIGTPSKPVTIANYTCDEAYASNLPLLSMASRLPQVTDVIGWSLADWTYANGTLSSTVLCYNLTQLRTMPDGKEFLEDSGLGPSDLWIDGTRYIIATEPNWLNPLIQTGRAVQEFLWYDAFYSETSTSYMGWSSGSLCAWGLYGLYGGNIERWQNGAGGVYNYYAGVQAEGRFFTFAYSLESVIEEWIPADFSCEQWYEEYVTQAGYNPPLGPLDPSTYLYLFAQNTSDPHFSDPYWQPPRVAPNIYSASGGAYNVPFSDQRGTVFEWGGGVKLTGHSEFLNAPGEYWYNSVTGILYVEPYRGHAEMLLTTFTEQQVPFTMLAHTSLGFNSAPTVLLQGQGDQPGIISANGYAGFTGNFVVHDLELAYGTCGLNLGAVVHAQVYNLYVHDIGVAVSIVGDSSAQTIALYNSSADRVLGGCWNVQQTALNTNLLNLSCADIGVSSWATYVTGISVSGSNPVVIRGCSVSNVTGNSNGNNGIFMNTGPGSVAEYNTVSNSSLVLFDSGALFAGGIFRSNEVVNVTMNRMMGYIGPAGVSNADAVYASSGAVGSWEYNLLANVAGACFFVAGFAASSFVSNVCVNGGTSNFYPVQYSDVDTAQVQNQLATFSNNWVLFNTVNYTGSVYPFQQPYIQPRNVYFSAGSVWNEEPSVYSPPQWSPVVSFPFYLRSLYGIPFVEGTQGSMFTLADDVTAMYGDDNELLIVMRNSVWQTEQMFALSTDQYEAGLQYGQANVQAVTAATIADLRAHNSAERAATEQGFVTQMLAPLPWYLND